MINKDQIIVIKKRLKLLSKYLDINNKKEELLIFEKKMLQNNFWNNSKEAEKKPASPVLLNIFVRLNFFGIK